VDELHATHETCERDFTQHTHNIKTMCVCILFVKKLKIEQNNILSQICMTIFVSNISCIKNFQNNILSSKLRIRQVVQYGFEFLHLNFLHSRAFSVKF
jgi:hypothetical protein